MQVKRDGDVAIDGDEFFGEQNGVAVLLQRLAIGFALDLFGAIENSFQAAEFHDQIDAALVADAGGAGDIVDGVAAKRHDVDDLVGRYAEDLGNLGGIENEIVFLRIEDLYPLVDELHHVLVARRR